MKKTTIAFYLAIVLLMHGHAQEWQKKTAQLMTTYSGNIDTTNVLPYYPRPQLTRTEWMNLNGIWQFQPGTGENEAVPVGNLSRKILVPFAVESAISGVMEHHNRLWYRRLVNIPGKWKGKRILLHFGAVDYESEVFVNGKSLGVHTGGYDPFSYDITPYLRTSGGQEIVVRVFDPTDLGGFPRGKQTLWPGGIMYTSVTGIWQTVWLEPVADVHIQTLKIVPDIDKQALNLVVETSGDASGYIAEVTVFDSNNMVAKASGLPNEKMVIGIANPKLWSPDSPHLYNLKIGLKKNGKTVDSAGSYFAMRKISTKRDTDGILKLCLNNEFIFQMGPLDQGYWPDGLYTAPTEEAMKYDLEMIKALGFNMVRKHIKVEPLRWYYWADKLGVMVWQDMPSAKSYTNLEHPVDENAYEEELGRMVKTLYNIPSIIMWVVFNEGQGQFKTPELVQKVYELDSTRLVNQASGWVHFGVGDILDFHNYPHPVSPVSETQVRACGEYGGVGYKIEGHSWTNDYFSYITVHSSDELAKVYNSYNNELMVFKAEKGLSAAVYTEITDVEIELNGLITYDRKVVKADIEKIKQANYNAIHHKLFVTDILPTSQKEKRAWKYTFNEPQGSWYSFGFDDTAWKTGNAGFGTLGTPGAIIGTTWDTSKIWMRQKFQLGDMSQIDIDKIMLKVHHDEDCDVYINGEKAVSLNGYTADYVLVELDRKIKEKLVPNAENIIAIVCKQTLGGQYIDAGLSLVNFNKPAPPMVIDAALMK
ncbi:MAG: beta-galactosidase [Bacteroidales bacterium]|nr:beta-galactosidase [Bacteroidales bacterium]